MTIVALQSIISQIIHVATGIDSVEARINELLLDLESEGFALMLLNYEQSNAIISGINCSNKAFERMKDGDQLFGYIKQIADLPSFAYEARIITKAEAEAFATRDPEVKHLEFGSFSDQVTQYRLDLVEIENDRRFAGHINY